MDEERPSAGSGDSEAETDARVGRRVARGAESYSGGPRDEAHEGRTLARGAESYSGGPRDEAHEGRQIARGAGSYSGQNVE